jgi:hypothetical protein
VTDQEKKLLDLCLKAVYAGHKYHLAMQASIDCFEQGKVDTPENDKLIERYHAEWKAYSRQAIELNESMTGGESGT